MNNFNSAYIFYTSTYKEIYKSMYKPNQSGNCCVCDRVILGEDQVYMIYKKDSLISGFWKMTCSLECANMFVLQNM